MPDGICWLSNFLIAAFIVACNRSYPESIAVRNNVIMSPVVNESTTTTVSNLKYATSMNESTTVSIPDYTMNETITIIHPDYYNRNETTTIIYPEVITKTNYTKDMDNNNDTIVTVSPFFTSTQSTSTTTSNSITNTSPTKPWTKIMTVDKTNPIKYHSGTLAEIGAFPWHIVINSTFYEDESKHKFCAGAIISKEAAITTAACFFDESGTKFTLAEVRIGNIESDSPHFLYRINLTSHSRIHNDFKIENPYLNNNLALIYFPINLIFSPVVKAIEVAKILPTESNARIHMIGFGRLDKNVIGRSLRYYEIKLNQPNLCPLIYGPSVCNYQVITTFGKYNRRATICRVESGAPISYHKSPKFLYQPKLIGLAGAVSEFGCDEGYPDIHTNVVSFRDWIYTNI